MAIFTENKAINLYQSTLGTTPSGHADALVKVGGESTSKFVPNINASKWGDEVWLNINNKAVTVVGETQSFVDGKADLIVGNNCHRYYIDANGNLEYEIIFSSIPASPEIILDLQLSKGLSFYYQPELTEKERQDGYIRPNGVVGSYAVYGNQFNNKYQTGKIAHIYRPFLVDSKGNVSWCDLFIDPAVNIIQILMDEKWLSAASYPVILDPTFGYTSAGGSSYSGSGYAFANHDTTDASGGNTSQIHLCVESGANGTRIITACMYSNNMSVPDTQLLTEIEITPGNGVTGWVSGSYIVALQALTKYWLAWSSDNINVKYDTADTDWNNYNVQSGTDLPTTWLTTSANVVRWSIYADYAAASGLGLPIIQNYFNQMRH